MNLCVKEYKCITSCVARRHVELKYLIPYSLQDTKAKAKKPKPLKSVSDMILTKSKWSSVLRSAF